MQFPSSRLNFTGFFHSGNESQKSECTHLAYSLCVCVCICVSTVEKNFCFISWEYGRGSL